MWLVPELTSSASAFLRELLSTAEQAPAISEAYRFDGNSLNFDRSGLYPVMVAAPWDSLLAAWLRDNSLVSVKSICREALELGFSAEEPSGFCADLWWLEVRAPCQLVPEAMLQQGVIGIGLLERLTDAHTTANTLLAEFSGGKVMGWAERAIIQWSFDDGEGLTLELRATDAHATLTYASIDLNHASRLLKSLFDIAHGPDTRLEPRPTFNVGLNEVYAS